MTLLRGFGVSPIAQINPQVGTTYTLALTDETVTCTNASAITVTVPANGTTAFPIGTEIEVMQGGAGQVTFAASVGVTLNSASGNLTISAQGGKVLLRKTGTNTWYLSGDLSVTSNVINRDSSSATISGTSKGTVYSFSLPANVLGTNKTARIELSGEFQRSGTAGTLTIEVKLGSTVLFSDSSVSMTAVASVLHAWFLSIDLTAVNATNAQFCSGQFLMGSAAANPSPSGTAGDLGSVPASSTGFVAPFTGTSSEDQTSALTFTVSVTMNTASTTLTFIRRKAIAFLLGEGTKGDTGAKGDAGVAGTGTGTWPTSPNSPQSGNYTLQSTDIGQRLAASAAGSQTITVPNQSTLAMTDGQIFGIHVTGAGAVTVQGSVGVTLHPATIVSSRQDGVIWITRMDTSNNFLVTGDFA